MVARLTREQMIEFVQNILEPSDDSSEEHVTDQLNVVCLNSPDPAGAMDIIIETPPPITAVELVDRILSLPHREISTLPHNALSRNHPLRTLKLDF